MEGLTCLLDTSVFVEHFRRADKRETLPYRRFRARGACMSAVTCMELGFGAIAEAHRAYLVELLARYPVPPFDRSAAEVASGLYRKLRAQNQLIEVRDLMIAATAIAYKLPLATLDQSHFSRIPSLVLVSAWRGSSADPSPLARSVSNSGQVRRPGTLRKWRS